VAVAGLNGMDIGGGKSLTARLAGEQGQPSSNQHINPQMQVAPPQAMAHMPYAGPQAVAAALAAPIGGSVAAAAGGAPPLNRNIVSGYDIEELVDAAMGQCPMPVAPQYLDGFGMPMTRLAQVMPVVAALPPPPPPQQLPPPPAGGVGMLSPPPTPVKTRILVLHNMVSDEDLMTAADHEALVEEVREECTKFGTLRHIQVPRSATADGTVQTTAVRKIFVEYATVQDAQAAEKELAGRQFGASVVETSYFSETDFAAGRLF
jgi:hypothetical protein